MRESVLRMVRRCECGKTYYIGIDGDEDYCDECISGDELSERIDADDGFGWRKTLKLEGTYED